MLRQAGLLLLTYPSHVVKYPWSRLLVDACNHVDKTLYVHIVPDKADLGTDSTDLPVLNRTSEVHQFITSFYAKCSSLCSDIDVRFLLTNVHTVQSSVPVSKQAKLADAPRLHAGWDILLLPPDLDKDVEERAKQYCKINFNHASDATCIALNSVELSLNQSADAVESEQDDCPTSYDHVVIGGTFDRLHNGHKLLLAESCLRAEKSLTIGVTDGQMNHKKTLCELMEPAETRIHKLREFLVDSKPNLEYKIVPIFDPFGPSIVDPDLQCIVVSEETARGGQAVNSKRNEKGLSTLATHTIGLIEDSCRSEEEEVKVSSSSQRKRTLGTLLKQPKESSLGANGVYIIGFTGGIASGKSSICKRLEKLGAKIVDCDKLGHQAYVKGSSTFAEVVKVFGSDIVAESGEINRRALGSKVFADKEELMKLNGVVWPSIAKLAKLQVQEAIDSGFRIIILDAAVLLEAGWQDMVNEIWVATIPKTEAVTRIMERNKLPEDEAKRRIDAQLSTSERLQNAHVIFSTLWLPEVTQKQVEKAWALLQARIPAQPKL